MEVGLGDDLKIITRVGELDIVTLVNLALVTDVGLEKIWVVGEGRVGAIGDGDGGAVHVHLAVAGVVEPRPCEDGVAIFGILGDGEVEALWAVLAGIDAATFDRLDDFEGLAAIERQGKLAGATVVVIFWITTVCENDLLCRACGPSSSGITGRALTEIGGIAFAGEVGAVWFERGVVIKVDSVLLDGLVEARTERGGL